MRISGTNRFVQMQNIRGNEDFLGLPTNKSSRKKTLLYTALAAAGLGAAVLAYKAGIFSADPEVPSPIPNLFNPIPSFKDFDQNGTLLPGQSVVSLEQAFSPPTPPDDNGFCSFANNDYDPSQNPFTFESDTTETRSAFPGLPPIDDKIEDVLFLDLRILLNKGHTGSSQINNITDTFLSSPPSSETSQTNFPINSEGTQPNRAFTYPIIRPLVSRKTAELSQSISINPSNDHSNILTQRNISLLDDLAPFSEQPANVFTNSLLPGNAFIIPDTNTSNPKPFTNGTATPALDFSSVETNGPNSDEHALVLQIQNDEVETGETLEDSAVKGKAFSFALPAPFNMSQPITNGTVNPAHDFCSAEASEAKSNEHALVLQTNQKDEEKPVEIAAVFPDEKKAFTLVVPGFNTSQPVTNATHTPPSNFCPVGSQNTEIEN